MSNKVITLKQLIDKGLLTEVSQIDVGEAFIGKSYFLYHELVNEVEHEYLRIDVGDFDDFIFDIDLPVEIDGYSVVATDKTGEKCELFFQKQTDIDPSLFI